MPNTETERPCRFPISKACQDRLQSNMPLVGYYSTECLARMEACIADLGCAVEQMTTWEQKAEVLRRLTIIEGEMFKLQRAALAR